MAYFGKPYYKLVKVYEEPNDYFWIKNETSDYSPVWFQSQGTVDKSSVQYSFDKTTWNTFTDSYIYLDGNQKVYLRNNSGSFSKDTSNYLYFNPNMDISVGGNLATLINWMEKDSIYTLPNYSFYRLFSNCGSQLLDCSELTFGNVKNIGQYSCYGMFQYCGFETPPDTSSIESIDNDGFVSIFADNQNLTTAPNLSSLESVGYMGLDYAFSNCSNMTTGLDLKNLTNIGGYGLRYLYQACYKLEEVTAPNVSEWNEYKMQYWIAYAGSEAESRTANVPAGVTIPENYNGVPENWTRVEYTN